MARPAGLITGAARGLGALVLHAPAEWSGAFLSWEEEEVRALAERAGCSL